MNNSKSWKITLEGVIDNLLVKLKESPDKNLLHIWEDLENSLRPRFPPLQINRQETPEDNKERREQERTNSPETQLIRTMQDITRPLELGNPIAPVLPLGCGTGTVATAFGVKLDMDNPVAPGAPKEHIPLKAFDNFTPPDIRKDGIFPEIKERIDFYKAMTPSDIKIGYPDLQGPFNLVHLIIGGEVFYAFTDEPQRLHHLLQLITDFIIQCHQVLPQWIGPERMIEFVGLTKRICECSCNLISRDVYREFVKPYDLQIQAYLGEIAIHPCSGPHVFEETLEELPNVRYTECGLIENACAGSVDIDGALKKIGGRPIILSCGQELVKGREEKTIKNHLDRIQEHYLLFFNYIGMYWKKEDDPAILDLHKRIDEYYYRLLA